MDASMKKAFGIKVRALNRTLKEFKSYKKEVESYDLNEVSQDKKKSEFYKESQSALEDVEKKVLEYYQQLTTFIVHISLFSNKTRKLLKVRIRHRSRRIWKKRIPTFRRSRICCPTLAEWFLISIIASYLQIY